jgi:hypothetical protein
LIFTAMVACAGLGSTVVLGLAVLLGEPVRSAALLSDRAAVPEEAARYAEAPRSAAFFAGRDSVHVRVPWDMTVGEFLTLYHLENNANARAALERQLGVRARDAYLREGDEVSFRLTTSRGPGE